jgi:hypothetical protein
MSAPCPFCGFKQSDFRHSHNWRCFECEKDYADWLLSQSNNSSKAKPAASKSSALFSSQPLPEAAQPVKRAQSLLALAVLILLPLSLWVDDVFVWLYPVSIALAGYYAVVVYRTGYALGRHQVYAREQQPLGFYLHLVVALVYMVVATIAWLD